MSVQHERRALNDALSQRDRLAQAPAPKRVKVDGRSLADLLGFAAEYGALIQFYDLANQPDGDWSGFFMSDQSIALALCAGLDLADIETELDRQLQTLRLARAHAQRIAPWVVLDRVLLRLARISGLAGAAHTRVEHMLAEWMARDPAHPLTEPARRIAFHFGSDWCEAHLLRERIGSAWLDQLIALLEELFAALMVALAQARATALASLETSLHDQLHPPQAGLWDAFAQLFRHAQASINQFPQRLVRFYHTDILQQDMRAGQPDRLTLTFTAAAGVGPVRLAKGSGFLAGQDGDGQAIGYALDSALTVDASAVVALRTVTVASQPILPGLAPVPSRVLSGAAALKIDAPFPLFGANSPGQSGALLSTFASLGFAVASPCLLLAGGNRTISLGLRFTPDSVAALDPVLKPCQSDCPDPLALLLAQAFSLDYSSAAGWMPIPAYQVAAPAQADLPYVLSFELDANADAWIPFGDSPMLRASLLQDSVPLGADGFQLAPYAVLSQLVLSDLSIQADVAGLNEVALAGPGGALDPNQPFALFGSAPVQYAAFTISAPELFVKHVQAFSLSISWFGLPVTSTGFQGYYQAYVIDANGLTVPSGSLFNNLSFTVGMEVVNPGLWNFSPACAPLLLFEAEGAATPLGSPTLLSQSIQASEPGAYYKPAMSAVRVSLETPDYGFGDILYAPNVMAASVKLSGAAAAAASASALSCSNPDWSDAATAQLEPLAVASASASERDFKEQVNTALQQAVAGLDASALNAIEGAIAASGAPSGQQSAWRTSLLAALNPATVRPLLQRLRRQGPNFTTVHANLAQWLADHGAALAAVAPALTAQAQALLDAASGVLADQAETGAEPVAPARARTGAGVRREQGKLRDGALQSSAACVNDCPDAPTEFGFPNPPWLPMAQSVSISYSASAALPSATLPSASASYFHLGPFDQIEALAWQPGTTVPLLAPVLHDGCLYIDLSCAAPTLDLLFRLAPPASGWPTDSVAPTWYQASGPSSWSPLLPLSDSTNGLHQSGIVRFALDAWDAAAPPRLCVGFSTGNAELYPLLAGLDSNAATASWQGPGGAALLGTPLLAGSVTKALAADPRIAAIAQPMASSGGLPSLTGPGFDIWLAERLRHKGYGIQAWDYASLVLAAFPSLWQVAVIPASNGGRGQAAGHVWIVAVPGPHTPGILDATIPSNDGQVLSEIAALLAPRISPFIQLNVTNPPYLRLMVQAELLFTDEDDVQACINQLNQELIDFLSPWPGTAHARRPDNYYTRQEVAHFVRQRPYVRGILSLRLHPDAAGCTAGRHYYTSALQHALTGRATPATEMLRWPNFALPAPGVAP